jgi:hypothetical protein
VSLEFSDLTTLPSQSGGFQFSARSEAGEILKGEGTLALQPFAARGNLDLSGLKMETIARALHRELPWAKSAGSISLRGDWRFGMSGAALSGEIDKLELTLAGLSLAAPKGKAPALSLESARLALPKAQLGFASGGMQLTAAEPQLSLGAASVAFGANAMQLSAPGASFSGKQLTLSTGAKTTLALADAALALPRLQFKQADGSLDAAAPALKMASLEYAQEGASLSLRSAAPLLSIKGMNRQGAEGGIRVGAATLGARRLDAGSQAHQPFALQAEAARITLADASWRRPQERAAQASVGSANAEAAALKLALPASGTQLSLERLDAGLSKLLLKDPRQDAELAHVDGASLRQAALDLAARRFDLGTLALDGGAASLRLEKDGGLNWSALAQAAPQQPAPAKKPGGAAVTAPDGAAVPAPAAPSPWRVTAKNIELKRFAASLADARQTPAAALTLDAIDASLANVDSAGRAPSQLQLQARSGAGSLAVSGNIGLADGAGELMLKADRLPLQPIQPYLAGIGRLALNSGTLSADGKLRLAGKGSGPMLAYAGSAALDGVAIEQTAPRQPFLSWKALQASDMRLSLSPNQLNIGQLRIDGPVGELLIAQDGSVNLARALQQDKAAKQDAPAKAQAQAEQQAQPDAADPFPVTISRLRVDNGVLTFADFSQQPQFSTRMRELHGVMTGLSTRPGRRARMQFEARIADYGEARIEGSMNPFKPAYATDVRMDFRNVDLAALSPYVVRFAGYEVDAGTLSMDLHYQVEQSRLVGDNRFVLDKVKLGKKVESEGALDLPLELALALLRDENGVINIGVPVAGDLQNPQFSFGTVVRHAFGNVLRNIVSAPFRALAALLKVGGGEELDSIGFDPGSAALAPPQRQKLDKLGSALAQRPGVKLLVHPALNPEQDAAALRSLALRRDVLSRMNVALAPDEDPGPINTAAPRAQRAIDALAAERLPDARGAKPPAGMAADAWHDQLLQRLSAVQRLAPDALSLLQRQRGEAVRAALAQQNALGADRVALAEPEQPERLQDGEVPLRLELAAHEPQQAAAPVR